jgi:hypothetical protein
MSFERIGDAPPSRLPRLQAQQRPLSGLRVLDLTRILAGPTCGRALAAYGADVMLVNAPHLPNIESIASTSRGKLSALIDLRTDKGRHNLNGLLASTQVFVRVSLAQTGQWIRSLGRVPGGVGTAWPDRQALSGNDPIGIWRTAGNAPQRAVVVDAGAMDAAIGAARHRSARVAVIVDGAGMARGYA